VVSYYVEAENNSGQKAYAPTGAPASVAAYTVGAPSILLNEIFSRGTPESPDWVEIYNNSDQPADIGGYKLYDSGGQSGAKPKMALAAGTIIPARGFLVVVVDVAEEAGFGLSSAGEEIWFENASGNVVDDVTFPAMETSQSYGRMPDGSQTWQLLNTITRGAANDNTIPPPDIVILMNEVYSRGVAGDPDWVEIYNGGTTALDISSFKIYDSGGQTGSKPKKAFPAGTTIPVNGFFVIVVDDGTTDGFGLSSSGEKVWIENAGGSIIDSVTFPALEDGQSYGRYPDGTASWQVLYTVTKGAANDNTIPVPPVVILMNEVFSRGVVTDPDWIEIFNGSTTAIDISGFKIYDSGGQSGSKPKKDFPAGTVIPVGGFYVIVTDDGTANGFGLSSGGEKVWLENTDGAVIDSLSFPALEITQSYGRKPDGSSTLVIFTEITRGTSNNNAANLPKKE